MNKLRLGKPAYRAAEVGAVDGEHLKLLLLRPAYPTGSLARWRHPTAWLCRDLTKLANRVSPTGKLRNVPQIDPGIVTAILTNRVPAGSPRQGWRSAAATAPLSRTPIPNQQPPSAYCLIVAHCVARRVARGVAHCVAHCVAPPPFRVLPPKQRAAAREPRHHIRHLLIAHRVPGHIVAPVRLADIRATGNHYGTQRPGR